MTVSNSRPTITSTSWCLSRGGEIVLRPDLVEVCEVNAHPPFVVGIFYKYNIGKPLKYCSFNV